MNNRKKQICLYHGTDRRFLPNIKKEGLVMGDGLFGYEGIFFSKDIDGAVMWAKWDTSDSKEKDYKAVLRVCLPASDAQYLTPDFNLGDEASAIDHETQEEFFPYVKENGFAWNSKYVSDIIWNDGNKGSIPNTRIEVCSDYWCKKWKKITEMNDNDFQSLPNLDLDPDVVSE